jgi:hypothetical protein
MHHSSGVFYFTFNGLVDFVGTLSAEHVRKPRAGHWDF